ncbi:MAG: hypothetical protein MN733_12075 [Nitrososphaera sp.]|nr:hypothetical protein [Nitrososphaera sp.]
MSEPKFKEVPRVVERARRPMGVPRAKLAIPDLPGYMGRVVNDTPGRIAMALEGGYEFVNKAEAPNWGDSEVTPGNSDLGTRVSRVVGTHPDGTAMRGYLMRIRKEWYDEDQAAKMQKVDEIDSAIKHGTHNSRAADKRYVKQISMA